MSALYECQGCWAEFCDCGALIAACRCRGGKPARVVPGGCLTCRARAQAAPLPSFPAEVRLAFSCADFLEGLLRRAGEAGILTPPEVLTVVRLLEAAERQGWRTTDERASLGHRR